MTKVLDVPSILADVLCFMLALLLLVGSVVLLMWLVGCFSRMCYSVAVLYHAADDSGDDITCAKITGTDWQILYPVGDSMYHNTWQHNRDIALALLQQVGHGVKEGETYIDGQGTRRPVQYNSRGERCTDV